MPYARIGTLTIGQTPRPDLIISLQQRFPDSEIIEVGALDQLDHSDLPNVSKTNGNAYLLTTRMRDGSLVHVPESFLIPFMANGLKKLETKCVKAIFLLCAGTFAELSSLVPLIKPFVLAHEMLANIGIKNIGIIAPIPEQVRPIRDRWEAAGFEVTVWAADATHPDEPFIAELQAHQKESGFKALVLDYVGHPAEVSQTLQKKLDIPVIDLGEIAVATLAAIL
ncbi:MAG: AroM family protein [Anaerolineae bacterium]